MVNQVVLIYLSENHMIWVSHKAKVQVIQVRLCLSHYKDESQRKEMTQHFRMFMDESSYLQYSNPNTSKQSLFIEFR